MANGAAYARRSSGRELIFSTALATVLAVSWTARSAQGPSQGKNKNIATAAKPATNRDGEAAFRVNCAGCHGMDARGGGHGPDLASSPVIRGGNDAALIKIITKGVPGTAMPTNDLTERETRMVIAYIRSLAVGVQAPVTGDREKGKALFFGKGNCSSCHMVNGQGGRLGPDLSGVGSSRSIAYLTDSIREPSKDLTEGMGQLDSQYTSPAIYETVSVVLPDGQRIIGVPKNEDNFSLQLIDVNEGLHLFLKKDLKEVIHERKSLMPPYDEQAISKTELQDLLAYLRSLHPVTAETSEKSTSATTKAPKK